MINLKKAFSLIELLLTLVLLSIVLNSFLQSYYFKEHSNFKHSPTNHLRFLEDVSLCNIPKANCVYFSSHSSQLPLILLNKENESL